MLLSTLDCAGKSHYLLYGLATAMQPRMLVTFDEELNPLPVSVRVGQAVDVVGAVSVSSLLSVLMVVVVLPMLTW